MKITTALFLLTGLLLRWQIASAWSHGGCDAREVSRWAAYERSMRAAAPSSSLYLPKPYPKTREEMIADFLYQYRDTWFSTPPSELPVDQRPIFEGVRNGTLAFDVVRVENWTSMLCAAHRSELVFYVLRIYSSVSGAELGRTALTESGFIAVAKNFSPREQAEPVARQKARMPSPRDTLDRIRKAYGLTAEEPQYVWSFGTIHCHLFAPCVAFRHGADAYIVSPDNDDLFVIAAGSRRLSVGKELGRVLRPDQPPISTLSADERLVSLGGDAFAVARKHARP